MRILYVVSRPLTINTSASIRNRATIMGLVNNGHEVELVTTQPDSNHMAYDGTMTLEGVKITYIKLEGIQKAVRIGRKFKFLEPLKRVAIKYINSHSIYDNLQGIVNHISEIKLEKYDIIISSSDPKSSHLFVEKAITQQGFKGRWIQIWGDPFLNDITLSKKAKKKEIYEEEKRLLSACDKIIYVSKMTMESQKEIYPGQSEKMVHVPIPYLNEIKNSVRNFREVQQIKMAYCGDYATHVRNIIPLYNAVNKMSDRIVLTVCGNSDVNLKVTNNVMVLKRQPYNIVEEIEKESDILIHLSNLYGSQIPGKIYQYSGTKKPILFILDGNSDSIQEQFNQYERYIFAQNNEASIKTALEQIIKENKNYESVYDFSKERIANEIIR